jgi:hypothetical protein
MTDLTQDELTVLMIAAEGQSMMPIGRWEAPVESLVKQGLLRRADKFNNFITEAGRKAVEDGDNANIEAIIETRDKIEIAKKKIAERAKVIANLLVELATYSAFVTGENKFTALKRCSQIIFDQAKEKL